VNDRFWPIGDAQVDEIIAVRAAASDPKRTFRVGEVGPQLPKLIAYLISAISGRDSVATEYGSV
jgi:hypothetical protein